MDPKQCLTDALDCLNRGRTKSAGWSLSLYERWRSRGGFEPDIDGVPGDVVCKRLRDHQRERS